MAKYLLKASYSVDGLKGVMKAGGTSRVKALERAARGRRGVARVVLLRVRG